MIRKENRDEDRQPSCGRKGYTTRQEQKERECHAAREERERTREEEDKLTWWEAESETQVMRREVERRKDNERYRQGRVSCGHAL